MPGSLPARTGIKFRRITRRKLVAAKQRLPFAPAPAPD